MSSRPSSVYFPSLGSKISIFEQGPGPTEKDTRKNSPNKTDEIGRSTSSSSVTECGKR